MHVSWGNISCKGMYPKRGVTDYRFLVWQILEPSYKLDEYNLLRTFLKSLDFQCGEPLDNVLGDLDFQSFHNKYLQCFVNTQMLQIETWKVPNPKNN